MSTWTVEGKSNCAEKCSYAEGEELKDLGSAICKE